MKVIYSAATQPCLGQALALPDGRDATGRDVTARGGQVTFLCLGQGGLLAAEAGSFCLVHSSQIQT